MKQNIEPIDDGMIHESIIVGKRLIVLKKQLSHFKISDPGLEIHKGFVAVEEDAIYNEGGFIFGLELAKFHGEIIVI